MGLAFIGALVVIAVLVAGVMSIGKSVIKFIETKQKEGSDED